MSDSAPQSLDEIPGVPMARQGVAHVALALGLLGAFAAADSWRSVSSLPLVPVFSVLLGLLAGALLTTLLHEWFHLLGARLCRGAYRPARQLSLLVFDWDFSANSRRQFLVMSIAGSIGSLFAIYLLSSAVPADAAGRIALRAAAWGSLAFAAVVEWPVLYRVYRGGDPLAALSRIDRRRLVLAAITALLVTAAASRLL
jgi:hypothetical protein